MSGFRSISGSSAQWSAVLRQVDRGRVAMPQGDLNKLLDTVLLQLDAQPEAARRALQRRIAENKVRR